MADPTQSLQVSTKGLNDITLDSDGPLDIEAIAEGLLAPEQADNGDADAKAKAEADAKAQADAAAKAQADADAKAQADAAAAAAGGKTGDDKPEGVLARDGKHVIPYSVLEATRQAEANARAEAERAAEAMRQLQDHNAQLQAQLEGGTHASPGATAKPNVLPEALTQKIGQLTEQFPELGEVFAPMVTHFNQMAQELHDLRTADTNDRAAVQAEAENDVQAAIDRNTKLSHLQASGSPLWNDAARIDDMLRADARYVNTSFDDRFNVVVRMLEAEHGEIKVPEQTGAKPETKAGLEPKGQPAQQQTQQPGDAKAKAEEELAKAAKAEAQKPMTLSDLPGGLAPETDDRKIDAMTPDEISGKVNRFLETGGNIQDIENLFTVAG